MRHLRDASHLLRGDKWERQRREIKPDSIKEKRASVTFLSCIYELWLLWMKQQEQEGCHCSLEPQSVSTYSTTEPTYIHTDTELDSTPINNPNPSLKTWGKQWCNCILADPRFCLFKHDFMLSFSFSRHQTLCWNSSSLETVYLDSGINRLCLNDVTYSQHSKTKNPYIIYASEYPSK